MAISKNNSFQRFIAVLLCFVVLFTCSAPTPSKAIAGVDEVAVSTTALAVTVFFLVSAGVVFAKTGDMQRAASSFYKDCSNAKKFIDDVASTFTDGVVTITQAMKSGFSLMWNDVVTYFNPATKPIIPYTSPEALFFSDSAGNAFPYFTSAVLGKYLPYDYRSKVTLVTASAKYVVGWFKDPNNTTGYTVGWDIFNLDGTFLRNVRIGNGYKPTLSYVKDWGFDICHWGLAIKNDSLVYCAGKYSEMLCYEISSASPILNVAELKSIGSNSIDVPYAKDDSLYLGKDVFDGFDSAISNAIDKPLSLDLNKTGIISDALNTDLTKPVVSTQTGVITGTDIIVGNPTVPPVDPPIVPPVDVPVKDFIVPDVRDIFPFCIPFDLIDLVSVFNATPVIPKFDIPVDFSFAGYKDTIIIDLTDFEPAAEVVRWGITILFILGLILITRKMIQG